MRTVSVQNIGFNFKLSNNTDHLSQIHNEVINRVSSGIQFIGEIDDGPKKHENLKKLIWDRIDRESNTKKVCRQIWTAVPGAAAAFLVLSAIYEYSHGEYWNYALQSVGIPSTFSYQRYWGHNFLLFLDIFGLDPFEKTRLRYVGPILGHAMIPNDCLPEFFDQLLEPAVRSPAWSGRTSKELIPEWLNRQKSFPGVDRPVWDFLKNGGEIAQALVADILSMIKKASYTDLKNGESRLTVPKRILQFYEYRLDKLSHSASLRSPYLKLDPLSGLQVVFPDQRLSSDKVGLICSWDISSAGKRLPGPHDYARLRREEAIFSATELPLPPENPYEIELYIGEESIKRWSLEGLSSQKPFMIFSGRDLKKMNNFEKINIDNLWVLLPSSDGVIVYDVDGVEKNDVEKERYYLIGDWAGYKALHLDLTSSASIEIIGETNNESLRISHPDCEAFFTGGDIILPAENSPDKIPLYGNLPPQLMLRTKHVDKQNLLNQFTIRISGTGPEGNLDYRQDADLDIVSEEKNGLIAIDIRELVQSKLCSGDLTVALWHSGRRLTDHRFRWVPHLSWVWKNNAREVLISYPSKARISDDHAQYRMQPDEHGDNSCLICLPEDHHEVELDVVWETNGCNSFEIPIRLSGPRWTFLRDRSASPVWQVRPIELRPLDLLEEHTPLLMLECRDVAWKKLTLRAQWCADRPEAPSVKLKVERLKTEDRWLVSLGETADTVRNYQNTNSSVVVEGFDTHDWGTPYFQINVLQLQAPMSFRWTFLEDEKTAFDWNDVCIEISIQSLLEASAPLLIFDQLGGVQDDFLKTVFWTTYAQGGLHFPVNFEPGDCEGRWHIHLAPIINRIEQYPEHDSEVRICIQDYEEEISILKINANYTSILNYYDCVKWAGENRLHALSLDLLCSLSYKHWSSKELLAIDLNVYPDIINKLVQIIRIECPQITIIERINAYKLNKKSYRDMYRLLEKWDEQRRWKD
ncbi:MAG: hypothetical protein ACOCTM_04425 [Bacteroidota bacterium]